MQQIESVVLCEGYDDRAFWAGWLTSLGCKAAPSKANLILDPWSETVHRGQFAYLTSTGAFVRVTPCGGRDEVLKAAESRLKQRTTHELRRLIVNTDSDDGGAGPAKDTVKSVLDRARKLDGTAKQQTGQTITMDSGALTIDVIEWTASDQPSDRLPQQQTLERLVCASIIASYPNRAKAVADWLASRPSPPQSSVKQHSWSHMAGWYAESGCERFYSALWEDQLVATQLEERLRARHAWDAVQSLVK
jgi:hypothetical protein